MWRPSSTTALWAAAVPLRAAAVLLQAAVTSGSTAILHTFAKKNSGRQDAEMTKDQTSSSGSTASGTSGSTARSGNIASETSSTTAIAGACATRNSQKYGCWGLRYKREGVSSSSLPHTFSELHFYTQHQKASTL